MYTENQSVCSPCEAVRKSLANTPYERLQHRLASLHRACSHYIPRLRHYQTPTSKERTVRHRQSKEASILWSHHEETRELPEERNNGRNNARCTQARKATHSLDGQHQDVYRTLRGRVNQNDRGQGQIEKVRPWCGQPSDPGRLKNRTECFSAQLCQNKLASTVRLLSTNLA